MYLKLWCYGIMLWYFMLPVLATGEPVYECDHTPTLYSSSAVEKEAYMKWTKNTMHNAAVKYEFTDSIMSFTSLKGKFVYPHADKANIYIWSDEIAGTFADEPSGDLPPKVAHRVYHDNTMKDAPCNVTLSATDDTDSYFMFGRWFHSNFGHWIHDNLPQVAWIRANVPIKTKFLLPDTQLIRKYMAVFDGEWMASNVIFIHQDEVVCVNAPVSILKVDAFRQAQMVIEAHKWFSEKHHVNQKIEDPKVIFYRRRSCSTHHGRLLQQEVETQLLELLKERLVHREEELVVYTGTQESEDGCVTMPISQQMALFRDARYVIGPHGSGMINAFHSMAATNCEDMVQVLEFMSGVDSLGIHLKTLGMDTYFYQDGLMPHVKYHHVVYNKESTPISLQINITDFELALDGMFGPREDVGLRNLDIPASCHDAEIYNAQGSWKRNDRQVEPLNSTEELFALAKYNLLNPNFHHVNCGDNTGLSRLKYHFTHDWVIDSHQGPCMFPTYSTFDSYLPYFKDRVLVFLGDSITEEHFWATVALINTEKSCVIEPVADNDVIFNETWRAGAQTRDVRIHCPHLNTHLFFHRIDNFAQLNVSKTSTSVSLSERTRILQKHLASIPKYQDAIFIINAGAHGIQGDVTATEVIARLLLNELLTTFKQSKVIFRTTMSGHGKCDAKDLADDIEIVLQPADEIERKYAWEKFAVKNLSWKSAMALLAVDNGSFRDRMFYMDSASIVRERPDGHSKPPTDCLHYCMPGPIDYLVFQMAALLKTI